MDNLDINKKDVEKMLDFVLQKKINGLREDVKELKNQMTGVNCTLNRIDKETSVNAAEIANLKNNFKNYLIVAGLLLSGLAIGINLIFSLMR